MIEQFSQLQTKDLSEFLTDIRKIGENLVSKNLIPYVCSICHCIHKDSASDSNYSEHNPSLFTNNRQNLDNHEFWPEITSFSNLKAEDITHMQIVGIYYTHNGEYLQNLSKKTSLQLRLEPNNPHDSYAISVWHNDHHLGFLPRPSNQKIFEAIQGGETVRCLLGKYLPSISSPRYSRSHHTSRSLYWDDEDDFLDDDYEEFGNEFSPERADITIHIFNATKFSQSFHQLYMIYSLLKPEIFYHKLIIDAFYELGFRTLKMLESNASDSLSQEIASLLGDRFQILAEKTGSKILL
jgi:hypothetical protein